ncbi:MAG TPA: hypothetical protein VFO15_19300, partial [Xanthobacteraceae bacterium]|nr:hypothetical protein [Xanthobacteraceae bacterium]
MRERRLIGEELAGEVGRAVSAGEYAEIVADRMLHTRRIDPLRPCASAELTLFLQPRAILVVIAESGRRS